MGHIRQYSENVHVHHLDLLTVQVSDDDTVVFLCADSNQSDREQLGYQAGLSCSRASA